MFQIQEFKGLIPVALILLSALRYGAFDQLP
jgi:hypothetical protein